MAKPLTDPPPSPAQNLFPSPPTRPLFALLSAPPSAASPASPSHRSPPVSSPCSPPLHPSPSFSSRGEVLAARGSHRNMATPLPIPLSFRPLQSTTTSTLVLPAVLLPLFRTELHRVSYSTGKMVKVIWRGTVWLVRGEPERNGLPAACSLPPTQGTRSRCLTSPSGSGAQ